MYGDNKGTIAMAEEGVDSSRTRHIAIRHHFIRDAVCKGECSIYYVKSADNLSDILTKQLGPQVHKTLRDKICNGDLEGTRKSKYMWSVKAAYDVKKPTLSSMVNYTCYHMTDVNDWGLTIQGECGIRIDLIIHIWIVSQLGS